MYDYGLSTLTQYGIEVKSSSRTRGALVCRTEQGILLLREFHGSEKKLLFQQEVLKKLSQEGCLVDTFIENQEGSLVTRDKDNIPYTLQNWYEGRECDTKSREDIIRSVQILARVHKFMNMPVEKAYMARSLADEYARHNQEIRKIRKFIRQKGSTVSCNRPAATTNGPMPRSARICATANGWMMYTSDLWRYPRICRIHLRHGIHR